MPISLREETPADIAAIHAVTAAAFRDTPHASGTEANIVDALRRAGALSLSIVALDGDEIVGHVAFSPAKAGDESTRWFTLGPVSVLPGRQRSGIGSSLIRTGLDRLRRDGEAGCILVGDPGYYRRFGFESAPAQSPSPDYAPYFMALAFKAALPAGTMGFHPAFDEGP